METGGIGQLVDHVARSASEHGASRSYLDALPVMPNRDFSAQSYEGRELAKFRESQIAPLQKAWNLARDTDQRETPGMKLTGSHRDVGKHEASFLKLNPDFKSHVTADHMLAVKTAELNRQIEAALVKRKPDEAQALRLKLQGVRGNFLTALRAHDMPGLQRAVR